MKWQSKLAAVGAVAAALVAGGSVVLASIPDAAGVIHGCRSNSTGALRVIDNANATCTGRETPLNWNQSGPPGPTSSRFVTSFVGYPLQNSTPLAVGDLASHNASGSDQQITTTFASRIIVTAQIEVDNPGGLADRGACSLGISDGTGPNNGVTAMGEPSVWYTQPDPASDVSVPLVGATVKPPGTYNVVVFCSQLAATGATTANMANLAVIAAAQ